MNRPSILASKEYGEVIHVVEASRLEAAERLAEVRKQELDDCASARRVAERSLVDARHGNEEWVKMFDRERASKLEYQAEITAANQRIAELESLHKDHEEDWRRIQDAERSLDAWRSAAMTLRGALEAQLENAECRGDEDCDHCVGRSIATEFDAFVAKEKK